MKEKIGYVTFADILGWKGIWINRKDEALESIINIKKELSDRAKSLVQKRKKLEFVNLFLELDSSLVTSNFDLDAEKFFEENFQKLISENDLEEFKNFLEKKIFLQDRDNFENEVKEFLNMELNIDLISDTFVITSEASNKKVERRLHNQINKYLINLCLKKELLIRGATAYGKYYKQDFVFLGPAIDEAASWHELGNEIGIYQTKTAELQKDDGYKWFKNSLDEEMETDCEEGIIIEHKINLKNGRLDVLFIDWSEFNEDFKKVYLKQTPFLPEIAPKYINSQFFLDKKKS